MEKIIIALVIISLLVFAGCAQKESAPETVEESGTVEEVSEDISEIDALDEDLDMSELENLDKELDSLDW